MDTATNPIARHPGSKTSACEAASVSPEGHDRLWALLAKSRGLRLCAALFPGTATPPEDWIWSAAWLVWVAGTEQQHIDQAEAVFSDAPDLDEQLVRRSLHLAGPWSAQVHRSYQFRPDTGRRTRTTPTQP